MHRLFPFALSAALLIGLSNAQAANPPQNDKGKMAFRKDVAPETQSPAVRGEDKSTTVIILDQDSLDALPNPYSNPEPRMISDAWAIRT